ncbi:hypothetical protein IAT38_001059 [Cryptococcus sp. DSM 104549]
MSYKVGVILGSTRVLSNTLGFSRYLSSTVASHFPHISLEIIHLANSPGHPLPLLLDAVPPAGHPKPTLPDAYSDPATRAWSATVLAWDGVIILTPQYNWSVPAPLKNALDHLFNEWVDLPVGLITLGGHGGSKVAEQLKVICGGGLDMKVVEKGVQVTLPRDLIKSEKRIEGAEEWLKGYEEGVRELVQQLADLMGKRRGEADGDPLAQVTA